MKLSNGFKMFTILAILLAGTYYMASHKTITETEACELERSYEIYLAKGETYETDAEELVSQDEATAITEEGKIIGISSGETRVNGDCDTYIVHVSDLYTSPVLNMDKEYLLEGRYTVEENRYLDEVLSYLIEEVGKQSRAGAVEAARFLTLRFPYKLHYFYENGRLESEDYEVDGEGRYYHEGLYLSDVKYAGISSSLAKTGAWGTKIYEYSTGEYTANGLDCSGFITWALYNAGYDPGDIGAGPSYDVYDLTDLGKMTDLEDLEIIEIRCGDLMGMDGHIGMVIGLDGERIYIAEAYWVNDLQVRVYTYDEFFKRSEWDYAILMDEYYKEDGNYTAMWS